MKVIAFLVLTTLIFLIKPSEAGPPEFWKKSGFSFQGHDTPLLELLEEFALSYGVELDVSPGVKGYVDGWHRADTGDEFLSRLGVKYQFQWFVFKGKLFISPLSDAVVKRVKINKKSAIGIEKALKGVNLLEKKFGWGELKDEGVVLVAGPSKYVALVNNLIEEKEDKEDEKQVMIFPLKYASVVDREIEFRNKKLVISGVATILQKLLEGGDADSLTLTSGVDKEDPVKEVLDKSYVDSKRKIEVEGDVRTNSIVIRDVLKKKKFYKSLINKFDIEKKLIEIEAIIVDINRQDLKEFGVDWQADFNDGRSVHILNSLTQLVQSVNGAATIEISDAGSFQAMLQALESKGGASIMANTSILTVENQPAVFDLSETQFIQTVGERAVDVEEVTAGTLLHVVPRNIETKVNSRIQMVVDIEDGQIIKEPDEDLPRVKKIAINTAALVEEGRSLVVGGYNIHEDTNVENKIPLLGDLPILGKAFSSQQKKASKKERLFILTPRISSLTNIPAIDSPMKYGNSLGNISRRNNRVSTNRIKQVFKALALGEVPAGYEMKKLREIRNTVSCGISGINVDMDNMQYIVGEGIEIFVSTLENTTNQFINLDEKLCANSRVLAVSFWPLIKLNSWQKTEVYVAKYKMENNEKYRPSLLKN